MVLFHWFHILPSPKLTFSPLKNDGTGRQAFTFGAKGLFSRAFAVKLQEENSLKISFSRTLVFGRIFGTTTRDVVCRKCRLSTPRNSFCWQIFSKLSPNWDEVALGNAAVTSKNGSDLQVLEEKLLGGSSQLVSG